MGEELLDIEKQQNIMKVNKKRFEEQLLVERASVIVYETSTHHGMVRGWLTHPKIIHLFTN